MRCTLHFRCYILIRIFPKEERPMPVAEAKIIKVPVNSQEKSGLTSITIQPNGHGSAVGPDGKEVASFTLAKDFGASNTFTFTRSGGKPVVVDLNLSKDAAVNTTIAGSLNG